MSTARKLSQSTHPAFPPLIESGSGVVYGPFAGDNGEPALGINLLGNEAKLCSFNCVYCDLGKTEVRLNKVRNGAGFPTIEELEREITESFKKIHASGPAIDRIVISGNGEPTLHPEFPELAKILQARRDLWLPGKPITLYSNGVLLDTRKIADAANSLDHRIVKLDAGADRLFKTVNAPLSRTNLARVLNGIRGLKDVEIQSLFFEGTMSNTQTTDVEDWIEVIAIIKPKAVHIYGLTREPATPGLERCDQDTLYAIASRLERKTQIKAAVIP